MRVKFGWFKHAQTDEIYLPSQETSQTHSEGIQVNARSDRAGSAISVRSSDRGVGSADQMLHLIQKL